MVVDICQSTYEHAPFENIGDKGFLKKHNSTDIICTECLQHWMEDCSTILAREIIRKVLPIYDNRDKLFVNKGFEEYTPPCPGNPDELKCACQKPKDSGYDVSEEYPKDLYPWVPDKDRFKDEDLYDTTQIYHANTFSTMTTVSLPEYMKYILCSTADISISARFTPKSGKIAMASVTFYGACKRPDVGKHYPDCGCSGTVSQPVDASWYPVADLIQPKIPLHNFDIEIYAEDLATENRLMHRLYFFMSTCIGATFDPIPHDIIVALIEDAMHDKYYADNQIFPGMHARVCEKCGRKQNHDIFYNYRNVPYCIDCAYKIIAKLAVETNLAEKVGLATGKDTYSVEYLYRNTTAWKRAIIDRYINAMREAGANPEIFMLHDNFFI